MIAALAFAAALAVAPAAAADCTVETGAFTWGFKESFRAYISGSIANGEWSTEGAIDYATPAFFSEQLGGEVTLAPLAGELAVEGAMRFTGHDGILDTTIANPRLVIESPDRIVIIVDIRGTTQDFVPIDSTAVPFVTGDPGLAEWSVEGSTLRIDGIPLTLTAEGAEAFGTYPAGEAFDAITLELDTTAACAEAAIAARTSAGSAPVLLIVGAVLLAVVGSIVVHLVLRARRRSRPPTEAASAVP
jgi:hypothetical protein